MMFKTHLAFGFLTALFFVPFVTYKITFFLTVLVCCLLPDIGTAKSHLGRRAIFRLLQWFLKHRDILHSFTFAIVFAIVFALFIPIIAFPFFLGYGVHLLADALTVEGIRPFWPLKRVVAGRITTNNTAEKIIFYLLIIFNFILLYRILV